MDEHEIKLLIANRIAQDIGLAIVAALKKVYYEIGENAFGKVSTAAVLTGTLAGIAQGAAQGVAGSICVTFSHPEHTSEEEPCIDLMRMLIASFAQDIAVYMKSIADINNLMQKLSKEQTPPPHNGGSKDDLPGWNKN